MVESVWLELLDYSSLESLALIKFEFPHLQISEFKSTFSYATYPKVIKFLNTFNDLYVILMSKLLKRTIF